MPGIVGTVLVRSIEGSAGALLAGAGGIGWLATSTSRTTERPGSSLAGPAGPVLLVGTSVASASVLGRGGTSTRLFGVAAGIGAALGGAMLVAASMVQGAIQAPRPLDPEAGPRPANAASMLERIAVAAGVGGGLIVSIGSAGRAFHAIRGAPPGAFLAGAILLVGGGVAAGTMLLRQPASQDSQPAHVREYLVRALTKERAALYRPDLGPADVQDAIRVRSALEDGSPESQVQRVVEELDRLDALDRDVLHVVMPTSSGSVAESIVGVTEAFAGGNLATVSLEYADGPSVLAIHRVDDGVRRLHALVRAIEHRLEGVPRHDRPRIVLSGYSLGAEVLHAALEDPEVRPILDRVATGAMLLGPHGMRGRSGGEPLAGAVIVDEADELGATSERDGMRIVVVQHRSDPVGALTPSLLVSDTRAATSTDRSPFMPIVTLAGTAVDMLTNGYVDGPVGSAWRGHGYTTDAPRAVQQAFGFMDLPPYVLERIETRTAERLAGVGRDRSRIEG